MGRQWLALFVLLGRHVMTPAEFSRIGSVLYGAQWKLPLSRALNVTERTIRRWAAGEWPVPPGVPAELLRLLGQRSAEVGRALMALSSAAQ